ncbi:hypothetical protein [Psychrobacillus sp. L4]|uniref:hypothetical protein n=1 Tax=Psychrobacillus sp. L4 TaxID=3236892 RepID=UPI0036F1C2D2
MLGISLLIFILLLMLVFVIASLFLSRQQTSHSIRNELDDVHKSIINQYGNSEKPPK